MARPNSILVMVMSLALTAVTVTTASATKQPPPPPAPTIVGLVPGSPFMRAIASDGAVYDVAMNSPVDVCTYALSGAVLVGRLFATAPPSPIAAVYQSGIGLVATLADGDVWLFNESCCTPCYRKGYDVGNIFTVAGTALGTAPASANFAPFQPAPNPAKDARPAARHPKTAAPGAVE